MINETLANELKKYLNKDNSEASLNSLSEFLNSALDEIKTQKEEAEKKIQRARETDQLLTTVRDYLLTHPDLSEEAKKAIKEEEITREDFEEAMNGFVQLVNTAVNLKSILGDMSSEDIFSSISSEPNRSFSGTITGHIDTDALSKFVSKF